jgi:cytoskeletal protein RodZ
LDPKNKIRKTRAGINQLNKKKRKKKVEKWVSIKIRSKDVVVVAIVGRWWWA